MDKEYLLAVAVVILFALGVVFLVVHFNDREERFQRQALQECLSKGGSYKSFGMFATSCTVQGAPK